MVGERHGGEAVDGQVHCVCGVQHVVVPAPLWDAPAGGEQPGDDSVEELEGAGDQQHKAKGVGGCPSGIVFQLKPGGLEKETLRTQGAGCDARDGARHACG